MTTYRPPSRCAIYYGFLHFDRTGLYGGFLLSSVLLATIVLMLIVDPRPIISNPVGTITFVSVMILVHYLIGLWMRSRVIYEIHGSHIRIRSYNHERSIDAEDIVRVEEHADPFERMLQLKSIVVTTASDTIRLTGFEASSSFANQLHRLA